MEKKNTCNLEFERGNVGIVHLGSFEKTLNECSSGMVKGSCQNNLDSTFRNYKSKVLENASKHVDLFLKSIFFLHS